MTTVPQKDTDVRTQYQFISGNSVLCMLRIMYASIDLDPRSPPAREYLCIPSS